MGDNKERFDKNAKQGGSDEFWDFVSGDSKPEQKQEEAEWSFDDLFAAKEEKEKMEQEAAAVQAEAEQKAATDRKRQEEEQKASRQAKKGAEAEARRIAEEEAAKQKEEEARLLAQRAKQEAERKAKAAASRPSVKKDVPEEEAPDLEEFSDTQKLSLNRLKPEIRLTSVEDSIREDNRYETEEAAEELYEDDQAADDSAPYASEEFEDAEDGYEEEYDDEYDDEEYEYEDGAYEEYDDGYDYDYEYEDEDGYEEYEEGEYGEGPYEAGEGEYEELPEEESGHTAPYVPLRDSVPSEEETAAYDYEAEDDEEDAEPGARSRSPRKQKSHKGRTIAIISIVVLLILGIAAILLVQNWGSKNPVGAESSAAYDLKQLTGVVTRVDKTNGTVLIYNADTQKEESLSLSEAKSILDVNGKTLSVSGINAGDIAEVQYNAADHNRVESFRISSSAEQLKNVTNAVPSGKSVTIQGKTYTIDDKLICLYQGQAYDVKQITDSTSYDAVAVNGHIYTIYVTSSTGTLVFENLDEYVDAVLTLTPASGNPVQKTIVKNMAAIELPEGSVNIQIQKENETLYTGKTFISGGKENKVRLPGIEDKKGKVVFVANVNAQITIQIDGKEYSGSQEIELPYGDYVATVSAAGYEAVQQNFSITQPYQQINVEFKANSTQVTISASIWGVSLYVDGAYQGELEGSSISCRLAPGTHTITCTRTGYYEKSQTITITEGMEDQVLYFSGFVAIEPDSSEPAPPDESSSEPTDPEPPNESSEPNSEPSESSEASEPTA